eukprot:TRINITY_DN68168_c0_g1_i1.p1 TRINITY_DN68168_c0_g1~~TRINITY_DN68168_c0_g1_i1.p1  ORF type:complete len:667 (+),score=233.92 TRINITY_DN68168_c0_g1_i1:19-2019(+)
MNIRKQSNKAFLQRKSERQEANGTQSDGVSEAVCAVYLEMFGEEIPDRLRLYTHGKGHKKWSKQEQKQLKIAMKEVKRLERIKTVPHSKDIVTANGKGKVAVVEEHKENIESAKDVKEPVVQLTESEALDELDKLIPEDWEDVTNEEKLEAVQRHSNDPQKALRDLRVIHGKIQMATNIKHVPRQKRAVVPKRRAPKSHGVQISIQYANRPSNNDAEDVYNKPDRWGDSYANDNEGDDYNEEDDENQPNLEHDEINFEEREAKEVEKGVKIVRADFRTTNVSAWARRQQEGQEMLRSAIERSKRENLPTEVVDDEMQLALRLSESEVTHKSAAEIREEEEIARAIAESKKIEEMEKQKYDYGYETFESIPQAPAVATTIPTQSSTQKTQTELQEEADLLKAIEASKISHEYEKKVYGSYNPADYSPAYASSLNANDEHSQAQSQASYSYNGDAYDSYNEDYNPYDSPVADTYQQQPIEHQPAAQHLQHHHQDPYNRSTYSHHSNHSHSLNPPAPTSTVAFGQVQGRRARSGSSISNGSSHQQTHSAPPPAMHMQQQQSHYHTSSANRMPPRAPASHAIPHMRHEVLVQQSREQATTPVGTYQNRTNPSTVSISSEFSASVADASPIDYYSQLEEDPIASVDEYQVIDEYKPPEIVDNPEDYVDMLF